MVPVNRNAFCGTSPIRDQSTSGSRSRTSTPSTRTAPEVASKSRGTRLTSVDLPAPVEPMIATVWPGRARERDVARAPAARRRGR